MDIKMLAQAKPILMSTPMVQASLSDVDPKTQTRRVIVPQPQPTESCAYNRFTWLYKHSSYALTTADDVKRVCSAKAPIQPGDILWVRETWRMQNYGYHSDTQIYDGQELQFRADFTDDENACYGRRGGCAPCKWKPSIHMPRKSARLFLRVAGVRAERLQDISEADALAEGIQAVTKDGKLYKYCVSIDDWIDNYKHIHKGDWWAKMPRTAVEAYRYLWDKLNAKRDGGKYAWDMNPWVWVYIFERIAGHLDKQIGGQTYDTGNLSISN